jgi:Cu2+-containing amine oxidase
MSDFVYDPCGNRYTIWTLTPGSTDGVADTFSSKDLWALRYHDGQIGDSATASSDKLSSYVNGESINRQDGVVWYVAHGFHRGGDNAACHVVGPKLSP